MSLKIGIVGLPNVGKSTLFNALCKEQQAQVANYPFCTIQPNRAVVPIPDSRLDRLFELLKVPRKVPATIEFVDIAGLVKGASRGEGLGNQFLANIRNTHAILHVVRCFEDVNVAHVAAEINPRADIEVVQLELTLADLQLVERKIERLVGAIKGDKKLQPMMELAQALREHLARGMPAATFPRRESELFQALNHELRLLTAKPMILVANLDEASLTHGSSYLEQVQQVGKEQRIEVIPICAKLEQELAGLSETERREYLALAGVEEGGLEQVIHKSYQLLGLISFFTFNEEEIRQWTIPRGWTAPKAAGVIHTDFERGFIRAEVISYETLIAYGSTAAVRAAGLMRIEGKDYVVQDGDILYIRFNV
ncbi:MAG: redox-regulated ATPase YchF [Anaerolineales bacterium]|nr:redox-regulated ATPase YchF [Anaerolineales bacterium]MDW8162957.1 redox-regulated ATPase YchF [Anaerolineales bacterium]